MCVNVLLMSLPQYDGWYLSMDPRNNIFTRIADKNLELYKASNQVEAYDLLRDYNSVMVESFQAPCMHTIGFRVAEDEAAGESPAALKYDHQI